MQQNPKSFRQIFDILWSISQNQAGHNEINWARQELSRFILRVLTLGLYS